MLSLLMEMMETMETRQKKNEIWKYYIKAANLKYDYFDDFVSLESLRSISYNSHKNFPTWLQRRHFL